MQSEIGRHRAAGRKVVNPESALMSGLAHCSMSRIQRLSEGDVRQGISEILHHRQARYFAIDAKDVREESLSNFVLPELKMPADVFEVCPGEGAKIPGTEIQMPPFLVVALTADCQKLCDAILEDMHAHIGVECFDPLTPMPDNLVVLYFTDPGANKVTLDTPLDLVAHRGKSAEEIVSQGAAATEDDRKLLCAMLRFAVRAIEHINATRSGGANHVEG